MNNLLRVCEGKTEGWSLKSVPVQSFTALIEIHVTEEGRCFTELYFLICVSLSQVSGWKSGRGLPGDLSLKQRAPAVRLYVCVRVCVFSNSTRPAHRDCINAHTPLAISVSLF